MLSTIVCIIISMDMNYNLETPMQYFSDERGVRYVGIDTSMIDTNPLLFNMFCDSEFSKIIDAKTKLEEWAEKNNLNPENVIEFKVNSKIEF